MKTAADHLAYWVIWAPAGVIFGGVVLLAVLVAAPFAAAYWLTRLAMRRSRPGHEGSR